MPFWVYTRTQPSEGWIKKGHFQLAGNGLLRRAWEARNKPINSGWEVPIEELIQLHRHGQTADTMRLIIQWARANPRALIEPLRVYAYTWGTPSGKAQWTPLMLRLRHVDIQALPDDILPADDDFVEFLYLQGENAGFKWGPVGMVSNPFIGGAARDYFRQFF